MKAYMTNGTTEFMVRMVEENPNIKLMTNVEGAIAYFEKDDENPFQAARGFEIVKEIGDIKGRGYVVMNNIPVLEEHQPAFEARFKATANGVENMEGFQAFRLLRPVREHTYVVFTQWRSKKDFEDWKNSDSFKQAHKGKKQQQRPGNVMEQPFITTATMYDPDKE